jgi:type II restriction enzyme
MLVARQTWNSELKKLVRQNWKAGQTFTLAEVYRFETHFRRLYPSNLHIPDKLRQTMQNLRDEGLVEFVDDDGACRMISK